MELGDAMIMLYYSIYNTPYFSVLVLSHILLFKLFSLYLIFLDFFNKGRKINFVLCLVNSYHEIAMGMVNKELALFTGVFN